jgi:SAM-dependent methyltransferase
MLAGATGLNAPGVCSSVERIPLQAGSFDGVAAVSLLGCLDDPGPFFQEAARLLVPGGFLIATHTRRESVLLRMSRLLTRGPRPGDPISGRVRLHSTRGVLHAMERAGFEIVDRRSYHFVCEFGRSSFPSPAMARRWERHGESVGWLARNQRVIARKRTA